MIVPMISKLFLDGGDPEESKEADVLLKKSGFPGVEGQTTNPTLIARNFQNRTLAPGATIPDLEGEYKRIVEAMARVISGPISIQVTLPPSATADDMLVQARERQKWIPNAVIKFPCTHEGLAAASRYCQEGPLNVTLVFSQEQAMAVAVATKRSRHAVYLSPFIGRLDDQGENGMDVVKNILKMYEMNTILHPRLITASVRNISHIFSAIQLQSPVITIPMKTLRLWQADAFRLPDTSFVYEPDKLNPIPFQEIAPDKPWDQYNLTHDLTTKGVNVFWEDWSRIML